MAGLSRGLASALPSLMPAAKQGRAALYLDATPGLAPLDLPDGVGDEAAQAPLWAARTWAHRAVLADLVYGGKALSPSVVVDAAGELDICCRRGGAGGIRHHAYSTAPSGPAVTTHSSDRLTRIGVTAGSGVTADR